MLLVFVSFWALLVGGLWAPAARRRLREKTSAEWVLDASGLVVQGVVVPLLQTIALAHLLAWALPAWKGSWHLTTAAGFVLNFVVVDYLYYWNHRALHARSLWRFHAVHHSVTDMDVLATSRNTLWTPALIIYLYVNAVMLFVLANPSGFAISMSATAALDLWRHSRVAPRNGGWTHRALSLVLITPHEHAWHHAKDDFGKNFGANLSIWDRIHGTYSRPRRAPEQLGVELHDGLLRRLFAPS